MTMTMTMTNHEDVQVAEDNLYFAGTVVAALEGITKA
jgi:hypothetical protein